MASMNMKQLDGGANNMWRNVMIVMCLVGMCHFACATEHVVGDAGGWAVQVNYSDWVARQTFVEGDTLVFTYPKGIHDVLRVSEEDYHACRPSNPMMTDASGKSTFELKIGNYFFICGFPGHCRKFQKLTFFVQGPDSIGDIPLVDEAESSGPAPTPSPTYGPIASTFAPGEGGANMVAIGPSFMQSILLALIMGSLGGHFAGLL